LYSALEDFYMNALYKFTFDNDIVNTWCLPTLTDDFYVRI